ncbi:hypothetical protein HZS_5578 [Henneguya salminicola]|nr:hypothetical protein HZS_5578 [Henneguya salminicola]
MPYNLIPCIKRQKGAKIKFIHFIILFYQSNQESLVNSRNTIRCHNIPSKKISLFRNPRKKESPYFKYDSDFHYAPNEMLTNKSPFFADIGQVIFRVNIIKFLFELPTNADHR